MRSPKYTSLSHLGHLGMAAPGPGLEANLEQAEHWTGWVPPGARLSGTLGPRLLETRPSRSAP